MLLQAKALCKEFLRGGHRLRALEPVDLCVEQGDFITITGRSGSGKTTLLNLLVALLAPSGGQVLFEGTDLQTLSDRELSALRRRDLAFVPQGAGLLGNFTVLDNVRLAQAFARESTTDSGRALFLLEEMGLASLKDEYPARLSGGERRRVAIARALFNRPRLLLADEPTNDLDAQNAGELGRLLQNCNKHGTALLVVTHDEGLAGCGKSRLVMNAGQLERAA